MNLPVRDLLHRSSSVLRRSASVVRRSARRLERTIRPEVGRPQVEPSSLGRSRAVGAAAIGLARFARRIEHDRRAEALLRRFGWSTPTGLVALGEVLLSGGVRGVAPAFRLGTVEGRVPDPIGAAECFERAIADDPRLVAAWIGLMRCRAMRGDTAGSDDAHRQALHLAPDDVDLHYWRSVTIRLAGKQRGAMLRSEAEEVRSCLTMVLAHRPSHEQARVQLTNNLIGSGRFDDAAAAAWQGGLALPSPADPLPAPERLRSAPDLWRLALHARELDLGNFSSAYAIKRDLATAMADRRLAMAPSLAQLDLRARARVYLGEPATAVAEYVDAVRPWNTDAERLIVDKFVADVLLRTGDVEPAMAFRHAHLAPYDHVTEDRFAGLVTGRRVAIVGPAPCDLDADLGRFDTILTTKQLTPWARSTASVISYYSDASALLDADAIMGLLDDGGLSVAVVRQSLIPALGGLPHLAGRFRVMPAEDSTTFQSTRFGLQRIMYDALRYRPVELAVFGTDLFVGTHAYTDGYANEVERIYEPGGYETAVSMFVHDYVADFEFTRDLAAVDLIDVTPTLEAILALEPSDYLRRLDR